MSNGTTTAHAIAVLICNIAVAAQKQTFIALNANVWWFSACKWTMIAHDCIGYNTTYIRMHAAFFSALW